MKAYWLAKANIFAHQKKGDYLVVNEKIRTKKYELKTKGKVVFYDKSDLSSKLIGEHNKENVAAVVEVANILKIKKEAVAKAVKKFQGLPHRLEFVAEINGVKYFDDSFATVPDVSTIALKSFIGDKNIVLLAGGADKGSDFKEFAREIKKKVKYLVLFKGEGSERLLKELKIENCKLKIEKVDNMKDAIKIAKSQVKNGDIVLLSTGCASFGCFKNYKDRGDQFKKEVGKMIKK
jgi:UDP-N-acetylmuramoylalanine--D-glutamate ligase